MEGAKSTIEEFFTGIYQDQISANGDQPLETDRTRPYHYRAYNLAAMVVNAKIGTYAGMTDAWNRTTKAGVGIQKACDYAMTLPATGEEDYVKELFPPLAAVASVYGDPDGKYAAFLKSKDTAYPGSGYYLLAAGLSDSGLKQPTVTLGAGQSTPTGSSNTSGNGAGRLEIGVVGMVVALGAAIVSVF